MTLPGKDSIAFGMLVGLMAVMLVLVGAWLVDAVARWLRERKHKRRRR